MNFEYKIEGGCSEARLNELGAQGWELVSVDGSKFHFKRLKRQQAEPTREHFVKPEDPPVPAPQAGRRHK
jgi:hypothetical protein